MKNFQKESILSFTDFPIELQKYFMGFFLDDKSLANLVQANKSTFTSGINILREKQLSGITFFNEKRSEVWHKLNSPSEAEKNTILQALHFILCKKENYEEAFAILDNYKDNSFIHQHLTRFILREHWQYQERTVLLKALTFAEHGATLNNLECCSLLACMYTHGLSLNIANDQKTGKLVYIETDQEKAKKYIIQMISLCLGYDKGDEYAKTLPEEKLYSLVGQGASQIIKLLTLEEIQKIPNNYLSALAFCSNGGRLLELFRLACKDATGLIKLFRYKEDVNPSSLFTCELLSMLGTLLLGNPNYEFEVELNNAYPVKIKKEQASWYFIPLVTSNRELFVFQNTLRYHFTLGLEFNDYSGYFHKNSKTYAFLSDSGFAKKFFGLNDMGKALIPPSLITTVISLTKNWGIAQERLILLMNFADRYIELQKSISKPQFAGKFKTLPILSDQRLLPEQLTLLQQQIFYHLNEVKLLNERRDDYITVQLQHLQQLTM